MTFVLMFMVGALIGTLVALRLLNRSAARATNAATTEARQIVEAARAEAEAEKKNAIAKSKELAFQLKQEVEAEVRTKRTDLAKKEGALASREEQLETRAQEGRKRDDEIQKKERAVVAREQAAEAMARQAEQATSEAKSRLEKVAGMTAAEARQRLADQVADEAKKLAAAEVRKIEAEAQQEAAAKAQRIIGTAIQRYAGEYVAERTVSVVPLPSDDMKGRLIGREGRNVRALEAATGADLIIDDTPEAITVSCFNPVRREIARLAIGKLVADGRIHPTRIEEVVQRCERDVELQCKEAGEQVAFDLGLHRVHPELIALLGGLKFRLSYAQNLLQHSIEVGFLAGLMASELGLNVKQARRAGLFHDIGKAADHEQEGAHAALGAQLLKKFGESPRICQAVAAHHEELAPDSVLDHIVAAANQLSAQRPGARRETLESYVKRLYDLEKLAKSYQGVEKAYAIQAGREVRVLVENSMISDEQATMLSKDIAKRIENEMSYAGQVRIAVLRETRAVDYAK